MNLTNFTLFELGLDRDRVDVISDLVTHLLKMECFEVRAKYIGAKKKKGIRGAVYRHAEETMLTTHLKVQNPSFTMMMMMIYR